MKKIILSLTLLLAIGAGVAFADSGTNSDPRIEAMFKKEFAGAQEVQWAAEQEGFSKATFLLGGHRTQAWFSKDAELVGSIRDISYNQLPLVVMTSIGKRFKGATTMDIREVWNSEGTRYKLTLQANGKTYKVSVFPDGNMEEIQKVRK
jgi:hypothetical protein